MVKLKLVHEYSMTNYQFVQSTETITIRELENRLSPLRYNYNLQLFDSENLKMYTIE